MKFEHLLYIKDYVPGCSLIMQSAVCSTLNGHTHSFAVQDTLVTNSRCEHSGEIQSVPCAVISLKLFKHPLISEQRCVRKGRKCRSFCPRLIRRRSPMHDLKQKCTTHFSIWLKADLQSCFSHSVCDWLALASWSGCFTRGALNPLPTSCSSHMLVQICVL